MSTRITPCLWFDGCLEEAAALYTSLFPRSSVLSLDRTPDGRTLLAELELDGQRLRAIDSSPAPGQFSEAVSFSISCADQEEVDHYWHGLVEGGEESRCGWLRDRFGVWWQVVPDRLVALLGDPDPARAQAATQAMLAMRRIVVADLEAAADAAGRP